MSTSIAKTNIPVLSPAALFVLRMHSDPGDRTITEFAALMEIDEELAIRWSRSKVILRSLLDRCLLATDSHDHSRVIPTALGLQTLTAYGHRPTLCWKLELDMSRAAA